jgi:hypothetical protein
MIWRRSDMIGTSLAPDPRLLKSLETLSDEENERLWAEEAERRDADWDAAPGAARPASDVLHEARAKLR